MLETIVKELQELLPTVIVEFDENKMQNYQTLKYKDKDVIYIEEYRNGEYTTETFGLFRETRLSIYIYNSGIGKPLTAINREDIRTRLEGNIVIPIIKYFGDRITDINYSINPSRYNAIETGILLDVVIKEEICL